MIKSIHFQIIYQLEQSSLILHLLTHRIGSLQHQPLIILSWSDIWYLLYLCLLLLNYLLNITQCALDLPQRITLSLFINLLQNFPLIIYRLFYHEQVLSHLFWICTNFFHICHLVSFLILFSLHTIELRKLYENRFWDVVVFTKILFTILLW